MTPLRDRDLVRLYWPVELRPAFDALLAVEDALLDVAATSTQPALGAVRMAWWRDALERLDRGPPPPEPRLAACAAELLPRGVRGSALAQVAEGYAALFDEQPDRAAIEEAGAVLFRCGAVLLGKQDRVLAEAGGLHALGRVHRLGLLAYLPDWRTRIPTHRFARRLRPLTALAALGARDLRRGQAIEHQATPRRALTLISHRLTGAIA